jgi:hypothetical protein
MDLGAPSSYLALEPGTPVLSSDERELGRVEHVLAAEEEDIFDGLVLGGHRGGGHRFIDAPQVDEIYERGVLLRITAAEAERLPEPSANPAAMSASPDDTVDEGLADRLRRAWDVLSGRA